MSSGKGDTLPASKERGALRWVNGQLEAMQMVSPERRENLSDSVGDITMPLPVIDTNVKDVDDSSVPEAKRMHAEAFAELEQSLMGDVQKPQESVKSPRASEEVLSALLATRNAVEFLLEVEHMRTHGEKIHIRDVTIDGDFMHENIEAVRVSVQRHRELEETVAYLLRFPEGELRNKIVKLLALKGIEDVLRKKEEVYRTQ